MSAIVKEVYDAFRSAGVSDEQAAAAALAIPPRDDLATKTHLGEFRTALKTDIAELRTEVKTDIAELKTEVAELRSEVKTEIAELRTEVKTEIATLRSEMRELRADTRSDMKDLELRMTHRLFAAVGLAVAAIKALDFLIG